MAGEWLKFECSLPEKPETLVITMAMGWDAPDLTVGKLMRLFRWFDQQTNDGNAPGVSAALLDRIIGVSGFVQAIADLGWIVIDGRSIHLANFDRHNGATAKSRVLTAKRVANQNANATANAEGNASTASAALPKEEQKRKETAISPSEVASAKRATRKCPDSFEVAESLKTWAAAEAPRVDLQRATARFRDHTFKTAHSDWDGAWRNWIRRASDSSVRTVGGNGETPHQRSQRERIEQFAPSVAAHAPGQSRPFTTIDEVQDVTAIASR